MIHPHFDKLVNSIFTCNSLISNEFTRFQYSSPEGNQLKLRKPPTEEYVWLKLFDELLPKNVLVDEIRLIESTFVVSFNSSHH